MQVLVVLAFFSSTTRAESPSDPIDLSRRSPRDVQADFFRAM